MKRCCILFSVALLTLAVPLTAQKAEPSKTEKLPTVREVLDKYVRALGGKDAVQKIKSRTVTGTVEMVPMNMKGTFESIAAPEAKMFSKITLAGIGDLLEGTDGKTAWSVNPIQGSRDRTGLELSQVQLINDFYRDIRLEKLFPKLELKGTEKVNGRDAYVVTGTAEGLPSETWYFDVETGLMLRSDITAITPQGPQPMTVFYEDQRAVDGVMVPFRIRTQTSSFTIILASSEIKHGAAIDESRFAKPKQ